MNFIRFFIFLLLLAVLSACNNDKKKVSIIKEKDINLQMIESYNKGKVALEEGDVLYAAKMFNEAELLYPQSEWAPKSAIMSAYAYYTQDYYDDAIYELDRFIKIYPLNTNLAYAHYLLAMCYYENIIDEKKDLAPLLKAKKEFEIVVKKFPQTDFALDAEYKIDLILDILAAKEIYVGLHYLKKEKWIAAINRFKKVIDDYETTSHIEEALFRLVEVHYKIGLVEESEKYASLLGYNYLSSKWYEESYRILKPKYVSKIEKIEEEEKRSKYFLIQKIKDLLN
jgi:outer membrane protein assembly factor BamD